MKNLYLILFCFLPLLSCSQNKKSDTVPSVKEANLPAEKMFTTLKFESDGKPCLAFINNRYKNFKDKDLFTLSLFIMVNTTDKDPDGHPTEKEAAIFNKLQTEILLGMGKALGNFCHVGTTTMTRYRDILLYINEKDQEKAAAVLNRIKSANTRIIAYTFESDKNWEAVAAFDEAIE